MDTWKSVLWDLIGGNYNAWGALITFDLSRYDLCTNEA